MLGYRWVTSAGHGPFVDYHTMAPQPIDLCEGLTLLGADEDDRFYFVPVEAIDYSLYADPLFMYNTGHSNLYCWLVEAHEDPHIKNEGLDTHEGSSCVLTFIKRVPKYDFDFIANDPYPEGFWDNWDD